MPQARQLTGQDTAPFTNRPAALRPPEPTALALGSPGTCSQRPRDPASFTSSGTNPNSSLTHQQANTSAPGCQALQSEAIGTSSTHHGLALALGPDLIHQCMGTSPGIHWDTALPTSQWAPGPGAPQSCSEPCQEITHPPAGQYWLWDNLGPGASHHRIWPHLPNGRPKFRDTWPLKPGGLTAALGPPGPCSQRTKGLALPNSRPAPVSGPLQSSAPSTSRSTPAPTLGIPGQLAEESSHAYQNAHNS